jgi:hypothetical protein
MPSKPDTPADSLDERTPEEVAEDQVLEDEITTALIQALTAAQPKH